MTSFETRLIEGPYRSMSSHHVVSSPNHSIDLQMVYRSIIVRR